ncbi:MAG: aminopeptidase, partial [Armatimonadetes bacterium]|nr:aminopeptidase [Armatimonadota bacterium]
MNVQEIAEQVVTKNLRIGAGDQVLIATHDHTIPLAEALAAACYRVGAIPLVRLFTDGLYRTMLSEIPDDVLRKVPTPLLAAYDHYTADIALSGPKDPAIFEGTSPARMAAMYHASRPITDKARERKVRSAWLMTGHATPERGRRYGVDHRAWEDFINEGLSADPSELASAGQRLANVLRGGKQVRITGPGTDLTVNLIGRQPQVQDGIVDEQDLAIGNRQGFLPTGFVRVA